MSLTGMKKHLRVLEEAELVSTEKVGRTRHCSLGPKRLDDLQAWMDSYRLMLEERFDRLEELLERTKGDSPCAYLDPELIPHWWGPRGTSTVVDDPVATVGGRWRFVIRSSDGSETGFRGVYREIAAPERIAQTFEWEGLPGHVSIDSASFEDLGGRTRVVTTTVFHTPEERDGMLESGMEGGMNDTYDRLEELLAG
jgi:uncharacterized protein YndB with AHSA1/START domain